MEFETVRLLEKNEQVNLSTLPFDLAYTCLKNVIDLSIQGRRSDSLLIFGPPGTGKTTAGVALGMWAAQKLGTQGAFFVDCLHARDLPYKSHRRMRAEPLAKPPMHVNLLDQMTAEKLVLVVDDVDALSNVWLLNPAVALITAHLEQRLSQSRLQTILIGTTRNPSDVGAQMLSWFAKKWYLRPPAINQISSWLVAGGLGRDQAKKVSVEVKTLVAGLDLKYLAPESLLEGLAQELPSFQEQQNPNVSAFAKRLCARAANAFLDANSIRKYEQQNRPYIMQSSLLQSFCNPKALENA